MTTWEEILGPFIGLADKFNCATCLNQLFRGSTGHWGQRVTLNKVAAPGMLRDDEGHAITFQCPDCVGREPIVVPQVHPNGQVVNHVNIAELPDHQDKEEVKRAFGDYDNRKEMAQISKQYQEQALTDEELEYKAESQGINSYEPADEE